MLNINLLVFAIILTFSNSIDSYIVKISKLYSPVTGKKVILFGDMHIGPRSIIQYNQSQKKLILNELNNIIENSNKLRNKICDFSILTEGCGELTNFIGEDFEDKPIFLDLIKNYHDYIINADQLRSKAFQNFFMSNLCKDYLKLNQIKILDTNLFDSLYKDYNLSNCKEFQVFKKLDAKNQQKFINNLRDSKRICCILIQELNNLSLKLNLSSKIGSFLRKHIDVVIEQINKIESSSKYNESKVKELVIFGTHLCDVEMLVNIVTQKSKQVFLFAGIHHAENVENKLLKFGYKKLDSVSAKIYDIKFESEDSFESILKKSMLRLIERLTVKNSDFIFEHLEAQYMFKYFFDGEFQPIPDDYIKLINS